MRWIVSFREHRQDNRMTPFDHGEARMMGRRPIAGVAVGVADNAFRHPLS
ncbi:MAG: hypothetical protein U1F50_14905 [Rubrivivax sp.]